MIDQNKINYILQIADNAMIIGERLAQWCGHAHALEQDIAISNLALDHIGQAKFLYGYAAQIEGGDKKEDDYPFFRSETNFRNLLITEQENGDFGYTIVRQFFFDSFNYLFFQELMKSNDKQLAAFAAKSLIEVKYHLRHSRDWILRLGDGTEESHERVQDALNDLWTYRLEAFENNEIDDIALQEGYGVNLKALLPIFNSNVNSVLKEATLTLPENIFVHTGGKAGKHTENLGHILSEMQYIQRAYPNSEW